MDVHKRALVLLTLPLTLALPLTAETVHWAETTKGKTVRHTTLVTRAEADGLVVESVVSPEGTTKRTLDAAGNLKLVDWTGPEGHYTLTSDGVTVRAEGVFKGKPVTGTVALKGRVWDRGGGVMDFTTALKALAKNGFKGTVTVVTIAPDDVGRPVEMALTKEADETVDGRRLVRVKLGLTGILSLLWSGQAWADPVTGDQIRLKASKGPGTPETLYVVESE